MRLYMKPFASDDAVLAGSIDGQKAFAELVKQTTPSTTATVCFLDFADIEVATSSFLRDSIIAYRNHARSTWPQLYPVASNLSPRVREELEAFLLARGDAFVVCQLSDEEQVSKVQLLGQIDGKQLVALNAVLAAGETDAPELATQFVDESVAPTVWNNRLGALAAKGILIVSSSGRNKRYRPVLEGLTYGT